MKKLIFSAAMLSAAWAAAQNTGINTTAPKATLDVTARSANTTSDTEGILIPRISKEKALNMTGMEESTLVYVNDLSPALTLPTDGTEAKVAEITENGFYHWNGTKWVKGQGKDGDEWVYDATTEHINLKRSGQGDFANEIFYTKEGRQINAKNEPIPVRGWTPNPIILKSPTEINAFNVNSLNALRIPKNDVTLGKFLYKNYDHLNIPNGTFQDITSVFDRNISNYYLDSQTDENSNEDFNYLNNLNVNVIHKGSGKFNVITAGAGQSILTNPLVEGGILIGFGGQTYNFSNGRVNRQWGIEGASVIGNSGSLYQDRIPNIGEAIGVNSRVIFRNNGNVDEAIGFRSSNIFEQLAVSPNIKNLTGISYGTSFPDNFAGTINNHYGIWLGNIDKAQNNYSIYTNAGKLRFGDLSGTGDRMVVADANGVLKTGTATVAQATSKWTNDATNQVVKLTNLSDGTTARTDDRSINIYDSGSMTLGLPYQSNYNTLPIKFDVLAKSAENATQFLVDPTTIYSRRFTNISSSGGNIILQRGRGTFENRENIRAGDRLATIFMRGLDSNGTSIMNGVEFQGNVTEYSSNNSFGTSLLIYTRKISDTSSLSNAFMFSDKGSLGVGVTAPTEKLEVAGNIKVTGTGDTITDGGACTNPGTISYSVDSFYGCTPTGWKKLHN